MKSINNAAGYLSIFADSSITVGSNVNGDEFVSFVFMASTPSVYIDANDQIKCDVLDKEKLGTVTMNHAQAKRFYESLKVMFEDE
ncbi:hypothetical protein VZ170_01315 [Enterobacter hormaechei]|uniref:hypothetical protein n=1 Tax=Enterobacter hormaechei TaxID=158836 RepID=UPI002E2B689C|nr:hypothetical protein [Enterobacter hormaechei]MED5748195.1 hypothetical protein [Enterobacter hormaechei]HAV1918835.1 hypothetical protein [Enterobacter hormaechei subsp. steigerwaltii]HCR1046638.1 hypothetical protein [Enterobacter hormaechei]